MAVRKLSPGTQKTYSILRALVASKIDPATVIFKKAPRISASGHYELGHSHAVMVIRSVPFSVVETLNVYLFFHILSPLQKVHDHTSLPSGKPFFRKSCWAAQSEQDCT
jgi:hypothetical protein|tara:strand:+ start:72 stop:398 length:327 start_codon:yes stop_codon:yes gene_type:complete